MDLTPWNPWQEIEKAQAEVDRLLRSALERLRHAFPGRAIEFVPPMDVVEDSEEYRLYISLPGVVEEDIDIALEGRVLVVRGEREAPFDSGRVTLHLRQWTHGYFERRIQLPEEMASDAVRAQYDNGVLTIAIAKSAGGNERGEEP